MENVLNVHIKKKKIKKIKEINFFTFWRNKGPKGTSGNRSFSSLLSQKGKEIKILIKYF
jgi:hypothetical protein